jgi:ribosomal protein L11 methylase PrmA
MDSNDLLPAGLTVHGSPDEIAAHFAIVALLQPVRMTPAGVVCAPRAAPELARDARVRCTLPMTRLMVPPAWPDPPSRTTGRWFIRSPDHIAAPAGFDGLVQVPGEGFGAWPHPTTLLCLDALDGIGAGAAIDLGCGSGLLSQAWATRHGQVVAVDLDPRAIAHAQASLAHAHPLHPITLRHTPIARALVDATAQVLLANVPPIVHREIAQAVPATIRTILVSGVRTGEAASLLGDYRGLGFDVRAASTAAGWGCWVLERR